MIAIARRLIEFSWVRYLLIGVWNACICAGVMRIGSLFGLTYLYYTPFGYFAGMLNSFLMNGYFTFQVERFSVKRLGWFFLINGSNLIVVEGLEYFLIERCGILEWFAVLCGMGWYAVIGFLLNQRIVFHPSRA